MMTEYQAGRLLELLEDIRECLQNANELKAKDLELSVKFGKDRQELAERNERMMIFSAKDFLAEHKIYTVDSRDSRAMEE